MLNWIISKTKGDTIIWSIVLMLSFYSIVAVYTSISALAYRTQGGDTEYFLVKHMILIGLGLTIMYIAHLPNYVYYSRIAQILLIISTILLLITPIIGISSGEARRWILVPVLGVSFQTSDLAKLALIMYVARLLSKRQKLVKDLYQGFVPVIIPVLMVCALIMPFDLSTAVVLFATSLIVMFVGRTKIWHLLIVISTAAVLMFVFVSMTKGTKVGRVGTWESRIEAFFYDDIPNIKELDQIDYAKMAVARGGWLGVGPGNSLLKNKLPSSHADFIFAVIIEEYGVLFGVLPIMFLYLLLLYRAIVMVVETPNAFGALLALGLSLSLVLQAMVTMAVSVGLLPVTGLSLPLVSMGGTSILFTSFAIGIIISVSKQRARDKIEKQIIPEKVKAE